MKALFALVFMMAPVLSYAGAKTIYGADSRQDFFEVSDAAERASMGSAVSLMRDTVLEPEDGFFRVKGSIFGSARRKICPGERFFHQRGASYCSGTLIAPDLVLTAGHCMGKRNKPASRCGAARFVFGFAVEREGQLPDRIPAADVYSCAKMEIYVNGAGGDYAVVRLDRSVRDRSPARADLSGRPARGSAIFTVGGPYGLPLKVVDDAVVRTVYGSGAFLTNLDTSGGNSGGGVFSAVDGRLIGVHTASRDPDLVEVALPPGHGLPETDARVKEGKCRTITSLPQDDGRGKKSYSLSAIPGLAALLRGGERSAEAVAMPPVETVPAASEAHSPF